MKQLILNTTNVTVEMQFAQDLPAEQIAGLKAKVARNFIPTYEAFITDENGDQIANPMSEAEHIATNLDSAVEAWLWKSIGTEIELAARAEAAALVEANQNAINALKPQG